MLLLPPYRPELNAIEMAWGVAKNYVASRNTPRTSFSELRNIILDGMRHVSDQTWGKLDEKTIKEETTQLATLEKEEARLAVFREQHPDLVFSLNDDSDSDDGNI